MTTTHDSLLLTRRAATPPATKILIWDLPVRLFHWLVVICVGAALITGYLLPVTWLNLHVIAGSVMAGLVLWRIIWGFTGSTYSRFRSFTCTPQQIADHIVEVKTGVVKRDAGHNPLGSLMVIALLAAMTLMTLSGFAILGGQFKQGPLKSVLSYAEALPLRNLHEVVAAVILGLIAAHLAGVIFESWRSGENLARAMVTGKKREGFVHTLPPVRARWLATGILALVAAMAMTITATSLTARSPSGIPTLPQNAVWKEECSACHMAFPASLLPRDSWALIMADLGNHFGEDASLPENKRVEIAAYLAISSAETSDSLPANRFRRIDPARPMEITASPFWVRMHHDIPDDVFKRSSVGAKQNCAACHGDAASGMFAPQDIGIPQEKLK
jgi:cytochrome b